MEPILSVLIVDDEYPLREELKAFDWEAHGAVLVGEAEDGKEALEFCQRERPDLVVTDITMPVMDGLTFYQKLKHTQPHTQVALLTCHSDFDYARRGLQLGALDYIVKVTMDENQLADVIGKARKQRERNEVYRRNSEERRVWEQSKIVHRLAKSLGDPAELLELLKGLGFQWSFPFHWVALVCRSANADRLLLDRALQHLLNQESRRDENKFRWLNFEPGFYLLHFSDHLGDDQLHLLLGRLLETARRQLQEELPFLSGEFVLFGYISEAVADMEAWLGSLKGLEQAGQALFYADEDAVLQGPVSPLVSMNALNLREIETEWAKKKADHNAMLEFVCTDLPEWARRERLVPQELKLLVNKWRLEWLKEKGLESAGVDSAALMQAGTLSRLSEVLACEWSGLTGLLENRTEILQAKAYVEDNLDQPITLLTASEQVGLSPNYLSRLFREATGESFNEYVTRLRMDKAVELLQTTNLKVYEVADRVGIPSYRYFSLLFRNWTGVRPTECRKGGEA